MRRDTTRTSLTTARRRTLGVVLACGVAGLGACSSDPVAVGDRSGTTAVYHMRTLEASLTTTPVKAAAAAAHAALIARGYTIESSSSSPDRARIVAVPYDASILEKVVVSASGSGSGSTIRVRVEPLGDQAQSHAILDAILVRLGR